MTLASRRRLLAATLLAVAGSARAQRNWREVAVPFYTLDAFAAGEALAQRAHAEAFAAAAAGLTQSLDAYCAGPPQAGPAQAPRSAWAEAARRWDALAALATGPLIARRSARSIDFMPPRPAMLARAIAAAPRTPAEMQTIGAPARGLPALEWLLWRTPGLAPGSAESAYALMVARDLQREADALAAAARQRVTEPAVGEAALARLVEIINQWVGGVEQLRWAFMRKPLDMAATRGADPEFPRAASGQTAATWAARWSTLRDAAVLGARPVPVPGQAPLPFETLLRGRGLNPLADRLLAAVDAAGQTLADLRPDDPARVRAAAEALGALSHFAQEALAPALDVNMGFSDADGD